MAQRAPVVVLGSSLGGFCAAQLANACEVPAVLLNPAVHAACDLLKYVGEQRNWHDDGAFVFEPHRVDELRAQEALAPLNPDAAARCMAIIAKGDEVLDWREMVAAYPAAQLRMLGGSDHALSEFSDHLDEVMGFAVAQLTQSS